MSDTPAPAGDPGAPAATSASPGVLDPLPFHRELVDYLKTQEAELWAWFSSTAFKEEYAATTRLELLKSCYRFDPKDHADLYALADEVKGKLGLEAPVTLYQSQNAAGMNAALCYVPGEAHLVLEGPVRATLSVDELRALFAHELTHYLLWERAGGELLVADQMLGAMSSHARAEPAHHETARLFRLYLEVHCDRAALAVCADPLVGISSLIKIQTGLADAQAESYLRQSEEIFGQAEVKTDGVTHPESFIRARALKLWADRGGAADTEIARMIEGPAGLGRLSLLGQRLFTSVTRGVLCRFLEPAWLRTEPILAHARLFFPDLDPDAAGQPDAPSLKDALDKGDDSMRRYACYLLLDLATVDRSLEQAPLAAAIRLGEDLGIAETLLEVAGEELELGRRALNAIRKQSASLVASAAATPKPEA
jgi:Zn-dependent protease with chaperone function